MLPRYRQITYGRKALSFWVQTRAALAQVRSSLRGFLARSLALHWIAVLRHRIRHTAPPKVGLGNFTGAISQPGL